MNYVDFFFLFLSEPARVDPNLHVADIKPPGQIKTVEVEVEPLPDDTVADKTGEGGGEGEGEREGEGEGGEREVPPSSETQPQEVERDGRPGETSAADEPAEDKDEPQTTPTATPPAPPTTTAEQSGETQAPPSTKAPPTALPPLDMQASQGAERPDSFGLNHPSPITRLPPLMSPSDDLSGQRSPAGGKKKSKPKALSNKDLLACHQDVARSNRELVEPSTPEFKPTPEWVSVCIV